MSGSAVVNYLLSQSTGITDIVPAARILTCVELSVGTVLPAINVTEISSAPSQYVSQRGRLRVDRVQVMVHAASEATKQQLLRLSRAAMPDGSRSVNGIWVDGITVDIAGPDLSQPDAALFEQPQDFIVKWYESAA